MKTFAEISEEIAVYDMTDVTLNPDVLGVTSGFHVSHDPEITAGTPRIHQGHLETLKDWIIITILTLIEFVTQMF